MRILVLGSGGREHAFSIAITKSNLCEQLWVAPGNAGTAQIANNVPILINDFEAISIFIKENKINLLVVGPEEPLVLGLRNFLEGAKFFENGLLMVGPDKNGALLEGSKDFAKVFLNEYKIPTAAHHTFTRKSLPQALIYIDQQPLPIVLKVDGLAAGKGVLICEHVNDAAKALVEILDDKTFGKAGEKVVIESFMRGTELSVFVAVSGSDYLILPEAKDYKRIGEGDTGLNTGGMGAVSPVSFATSAFMKEVEERIVKPSVMGLITQGIDYKGFLFIGLMNVAGHPNVIEYNVRMGDPETEVVLPRIKSDFLALLVAIANGTLASYKLEVDNRYSACVMAVAEGYPGNYTKGTEINIDKTTIDGQLIHAGTIRTESGKLVTNGGRVMCAQAMHDTLEKSVTMAYQMLKSVQYHGMYYRNDIGKDLLKNAGK